MSAQEQFAVGMDLLNVRKRLEETFVEIFIPESGDLVVGELVIAEEAGDDLLLLSGDVELLLEALGGGDDVAGGGGASGEGLGNPVAAIGQGFHLELHPIQRLLSRHGSSEEVPIDGERPLFDGGSEIPARLRGVVGVEGGESIQRRQQIRRFRPSRFQNLLQLPGKPRRQCACACCRPHSSLFFLSSFSKKTMDSLNSIHSFHFRNRSHPNSDRTDELRAANNWTFQ